MECNEEVNEDFNIDVLLAKATFFHKKGSRGQPGASRCLHAVCEKMGMCLQRVVKSWLRHVIHTEYSAGKPEVPPRLFFFLCFS